MTSRRPKSHYLCPHCGTVSSAKPILIRSARDAQPGDAVLYWSPVLKRVQRGQFIGIQGIYARISADGYRPMVEPERLYREGAEQGSLF